MCQYCPCFGADSACAPSDLAQQELALLLQQAAAPDAHTSFDLSSGGETWEQNVRRIATDVVGIMLNQAGACEYPAMLSLSHILFQHLKFFSACCVMQSRTDCGPSENTTAEERDAISSRLTQILTAYAYSDPAVGYCQGKPCFSSIVTLPCPLHVTAAHTT